MPLLKQNASEEGVWKGNLRFPERGYHLIMTTDASGTAFGAHYHKKVNLSPCSFRIHCRPLK